MTNSKDSLITDAALLSQAEKLCKQRVEQAPENRAALRSLAEVYRKMGNLAGAATTYERLFSLDPQDQEAGYMQAVLGGKEWPHAPDGVRAAPFVLLKGFLPREFHDALLPFMMSVQGQMIPMLDGDGAYNPDSRQALEFQGEWDKRRFRDALAAVLARVIPRLYLPCFPIGQIEVQMRAYQDGHFFRVHRDAAPRSRYANRAINYVYYFHRQPRPFGGGELLLFDSDPEADTFTESGFTRVVPEDNSVVFFPPNFFHSVVPVRCPSKEFADSRFVINGHVRKRLEAAPAAQGSAEPSAHGGIGRRA